MSGLTNTESDRSQKERAGATADRGRGGEEPEDTKTRPDMRRPPPGGRAGVVSTADSGGEEPDRGSTVANDP